MNPLALLKALSPTMWVIIALSAALSVQSLRLHNCQGDRAELEGKVAYLNQKIDMFRAEAALMGESLKKHKKIAADLRKTSKQKEREIVKQPVIAECNKAVVISATRAKESLKQAFGE